MSFRRIFPGIVCVLFLLVAAFAFITFRDMGGFRTIPADEPDRCRPVLGVLSSEDITIDPDCGVAFISGDDRRGTKGVRVPGAIYGYSLETPQVQPENLTSDLELEFHPHGLDLYHGPGNCKSLFVVNHRSERDSIEIFDIRNSSLVHRQSVTDDLLSEANDVVALDDQSFYVTRDHGYSSVWGRWLEKYLRIGRSSVIYYDGREFRPAAQGLVCANGINLSPDGRLLYVSATLEGRIPIYSRDPEDGSLSLQDEIFLDTGVDNIEVDDEGNLWIAAHPKLLDFVEYSRDPSALSPSQVLKVSFAEDGSHSVEQIYLSDGQYLSGSSVAARWRNYLLIGSMFDRRFLVCQIETDARGNVEPEE
jgi:arylesterase/paraoxonase